MTYTLQHAGVDETRIMEQSLRRFGKLPDRMMDVPELLPGLEIFYHAFMDLTSCRSLGNTSGPIPWTAIREWCNEHEIQGDGRHELFFHVRAMDIAYLEFQAVKMKNKK